MDIDSALNSISSQLMANNLKTLSTLETTILKEVWKGRDGKTYDEIGNSKYLVTGSVKTAAYKLWKRLSKIYGEKVNRDNVQAVVERYHRKLTSDSPPLSIPPKINQSALDLDRTDDVSPKGVIFPTPTSTNNTSEATEPLFHRVLPQKTGSEQGGMKAEKTINQIEKTLRDKTNWEQKKLFGIEKELERLGKNLRSREGYWLMSLTGSGGIGKTSLTEKLVGEYAADSGFAKLAWTTAKKTYLGADMSIEKGKERKGVNSDSIIHDIASQLCINLPPANKDHFFALQKKLKLEPYLIVIDNLETLPQYEHLLERFNPFDPTCNIRPSKVIFTSRKDLKANNYAVREFKMSGLDRLATLEMVRYQGQELDIVKEALDEELYPIYHKTQGNPLMILLTMNLLKIYCEPLEKIFQRLETNQDIQEFLYEESLMSLSDRAMRVLNAAIEYSPNYLIPHSDLQKSSDLNDSEFSRAITECNQWNLLDSSRSLKLESRYSIHSLLYEFLRRIKSE